MSVKGLHNQPISLRTTILRGLLVFTGDSLRIRESYYLIGDILISFCNHPGSMQVFILTESIFVFSASKLHLVSALYSLTPHVMLAKHEMSYRTFSRYVIDLPQALRAKVLVEQAQLISQMSRDVRES